MNSGLSAVGVSLAGRAPHRRRIRLLPHARLSGDPSRRPHSGPEPTPERPVLVPTAAATGPPSNAYSEGVIESIAKRQQRAAFQVLVIPYRRTLHGVLFALF